MLGLFKFYDSLGVKAKWITFIVGIILGLGIAFVGVIIPGWIGLIIAIFGMLLTYLMCALAGRRSP